MQPAGLKASLFLEWLCGMLALGCHSPHAVALNFSPRLVDLRELQVCCFGALWWFGCWKKVPVFLFMVLLHDSPDWCHRALMGHN